MNTWNNPHLIETLTVHRTPLEKLRDEHIKKMIEDMDKNDEEGSDED